MASFYQQRMFLLHDKFGLSQNAVSMLKAYDDYKMARMDEPALGRLVRLSPKNRKSLLMSMVKCAKYMRDNPKEQEHCLAIILSCGEMIEIADKPPQMDGFPQFMKLPPEIRHRIYAIYLETPPWTSGPLYAPRQPLVPWRPPRAYPMIGALCCAPDIPGEGHTHKNLSLAFVSKPVAREVLALFYGARAFAFPCACALARHLRVNRVLASHLHTASFHWAGREADAGISALARVRSLRSLTVTISKVTTRHVSARERDIRRFFDRRGAGGVGAGSCLPEALGFDELLALRGLDEVHVQHADKRKADRRTEQELIDLQNLLREKVMQKREGGDDEEDLEEATSL
ncbi:hypothetical protein F5Y15DRAFT_428444 [Xylariaceae sp. FL0016]|nr:hypothetical protein F5Y15DRAFT_428444 [Xylariaceae sp. FL0016]